MSAIYSGGSPLCDSPLDYAISNCHYSSPTISCRTSAKAAFKEVPTNHVFYKAILWGSQKKVTTGYTSGKNAGKFMINENCTRGQIVTFLYRAK